MGKRATGRRVEQEKKIWDGLSHLCTTASLLLLDHALDDLRLLNEECTNDAALHINFPFIDKEYEYAPGANAVTATRTTVCALNRLARLADRCILARAEGDNLNVPS